MKNLDLSKSEVDIICNAFALLIADISNNADEDGDEDEDEDDYVSDPEMLCVRLSDLAARIRAGAPGLTLGEVRNVCLALDYYIEHGPSNVYAYRILRNRFPVAP